MIIITIDFKEWLAFELRYDLILLMVYQKVLQTIFQLFHVCVKVVFIIHIIQFLRPTRSSYIRIYDGNGTEVIRLNAATSPDVTFPQTSQGRVLTFRTTNFIFTAKRSYYVLFDPGGYMCIILGMSYFHNQALPLLYSYSFHHMIYCSY